MNLGLDFEYLSEFLNPFLLLRSENVRIVYFLCPLIQSQTFHITQQISSYLHTNEFIISQNYCEVKTDTTGHIVQNKFGVLILKYFKLGHRWPIFEQLYRTVELFFVILVHTIQEYFPVCRSCTSCLKTLHLQETEISVLLLEIQHRM